MFELGKESLDEHKKVVGLLANETEIETHFVGKDFYSNKTENQHLHFYDSFENFALAFKDSKLTKKLILIKGSRGMALERTLDII